jgi:transposase
MRRFQAAYPPESKWQMFELVRSGPTTEGLSREFEPTAQSIANWIREAERDTGKRLDGAIGAERDELNWFRRENQRPREERDVLAKAAAWFARENKACLSGFSVS